MVSASDIRNVIGILKKETSNFREPTASAQANASWNPFKVLISCLLSLRTKDAVTEEASARLFNLADTPEGILRLDRRIIERAIYPVGFYKTKAKRIKEICKVLLENYDGSVPDDIDELLKLKGVGRKTAGIVMCYGHRKVVSIPTDSHVHQIVNRLDWVKTKNPNQTEVELMKIIPREHWLDFNNIFVAFGQNICVPVSPWCSKCGIRRYCRRVGVKRSR